VVVGDVAPSDVSFSAWYSIDATVWIWRRTLLRSTLSRVSNGVSTRSRLSSTVMNVRAFIPELTSGSQSRANLPGTLFFQVRLSPLFTASTNTNLAGVTSITSASWSACDRKTRESWRRSSCSSSR